MQDETSAASAREKPDFDSLLADLFGLNIRGAQTLGDLVIRPKAVFESARVFDWRSKYTPTMRLAFSILTVFSLLSFFWAAEDGVLYQTLLAQFSEIFENHPDSPNVNEMIDTIFAGYNFIYPFTYMLIHSIAGSLLFVWGKGTSWVARIRLYFCVASLGIGISVASLLIIPFVDPNVFWIYSLAGMSIGVLAYILTYARGMRGHFSIGGLIWRTGVPAFVITLTDIIVATTAGTAASLWAESRLT